MKTAVVTIAIGSFYKKLAELTHPRIKKYAEKIGSDFIVWTDQGKRSTAHYRKLDIKDLFNQGYERIIYIDTDILLREDTPNLFEIVPDDRLGIFNENKFVQRTGQFLSFLNEIKYPEDMLASWDEKYYNTGIFVLSAKHAEAFFEEPETEYCHFYEQSWLNLTIHDKKIPVFDLPYSFNRMTCMEGVVAESRFASYCIHYAGAHYVLGDDAFLKQVAQDNETWEKDFKSGFQYKKKFAVLISGGLGDVVAAEPAVRFFCKKEFLNEDIVLVTEFPELFAHLKDKNTLIVKSGSSLEDIKERRMLDTLHTPQHPYFSFVLPLTTHQLTMASHLLMRHEIPLESRTIHIPRDESDLKSVESRYGSLKDYVLLHPGKHWQSKTFPKDVWQSYIDGLVEKGFKVAIVGKNQDFTRGVVANLNFEKCLDLVDKLSLQELVCAMDQAKVLISNDSSPIHLAGATDINIGLIPTSKRPWCIFPYRHGSINYKTKSLYRDELWEDYPCHLLVMNEVRVEKVKEERLRECLPTVQQVVSYVESCFCE